MTMRALRLAFIVGILAIVTAYFVVTKRPSNNHAEQQVTITGNYSDDWMTTCGAVQGSAQNVCTARLDAAYGRVAGSPVPASTTDDGSNGAPKSKDTLTRQDRRSTENGDKLGVTEEPTKHE